MNTLTIAKPIIIRQFIGTERIFTYENYTISYRYIFDYETLTPAYKDIYFGKAFVDDAGYIKVDITDIVKQYAFRHEYIYLNDTQIFAPDNYTQTNTLEPIENANRYRTTIFSIRETNSGAWSQNIGISALFFPDFMQDEELTNPYDGSDARLLSINYSGITPRVPLVYTDKYFIGFESIIGQQGAEPSNTLTIDGDSMGAATITYTGYGNYSASYPLSGFWGLFDNAPDIDVIDAGGAEPESDDIDAGGADSNFDYIPTFGAGLYYDADNDIISYNGQPVIAVDACPERYYISWVTPFGEWQSQPIQSVAVTENSDNFNINTTRRVLYNISNTNTASFLCRSFKLNNREWKLFNTMMFAPFVLLYDVEKDKAYYTTLETTSMTARDKATNQHICEFTLKQINKTIN